MGREKIKYSEAIDRLRKIVDEVENDNLEIDKLTEKIKEAGTLISFCEAELTKADVEIEKMINSLQLKKQ